ncbi:MMPL family transporter [Amycolatopsis sp. cg5]|uniref:MMPL family transporter n=1 Tax=Amycolatopsis sp. cg5 TaxID=3238802 RepID=UPI0035239D24
METMTRTEGRLGRLAGWSQRNRWLAVVLWVLTLAAITFASNSAGSSYHNDTSLPGTESQQIRDQFPENGATIQIVFPGNASVDGMLAEVRTLPHVKAVAEPVLSANGKTGYATVALDDATPGEDVRKIIDTATKVDGVALSGDAVRAAQESGGGASEGIGLLAALVILVFLFRSLLAAGLPVITAVFAVGSTLGVIVLVSRLVDIADYTAPLMMLVGLGVGVDYALLIFSRYRSEILDGHDRETAARRALDTAGRSVLFAGCTVMIALLGLLALGLGSLRGVALAVALTVLVTMIASITLLPALLSLFGKRIERNIQRRKVKHGNAWRKLGEAVQRRPWAPLAVGLVALIGLSVPALGMRLGFADSGTDPSTSTTRQAYDMLADGFGPGFNGPLIVVSENAYPVAVQQKLTSTPGVDRILPQGPIVLVYPTTAPQDAATAELVGKLRTEVLPTLQGKFLVGGSVAAAADFASAVSDRLPLFILVVVGLSALLLMVVFRSILIPVKAALLNLLSIGASLGVITMVFSPTGPIEAFVPVMIFAIVFGLSMDYEVFLVSRMHEEYKRTGDARHAVTEGLAATGGVITAAAAIMIVVFGAFLLNPSRMLQQFGMGLAVAVLLDALVIRCLVVPAVMRLLGDRAWWFPRSLRKLPTVALEA